MKYIMVTVKVYREGRYYVGECLELGVSSFGTTEDDASARLEEATLCLHA